MEQKQKRFVKDKVKKNFKRFRRIPANQTIITLPQCMRNTKKCKAREAGPLYICQRCGMCQIDEIIGLAEKQGYGSVYILKGGRAVNEIMKKEKPEAVLGIACGWEGYLGLKETNRLKVTAEFVPLLKDGCSDTEVSITAVKKMMEKNE